MMADRNPAAAYPSPPHYPSAPSPAHSIDKSPMSSRSPEQFVSAQAQAQAQAAQSSADKGPLSLNLGFLKALTEKRTTRDGNPPKRRGPKPDSKPALTRRQELNRQAQRTHRERKELYIKALEDEVLRLKEIFSNMSQDKDKMVDENRQLRQLLAQNGIAWGGGASVASPPSNLDDVMSNPSVGYSASSTGYGQAFTPPLTSQSTAPSVTSSGAGAHHHHSPHGRSHSHSHSQQQIGYATTTSGNMGSHQMRQMAQHQHQSRGIDMDQAGIDFVLTLEKPCMDHLPWLLERSAESGGEPCGHALMASCPPEPFTDLSGEIPFGYTNIKQERQQAGSNALTPISAGGLSSAGGQNPSQQEPAQRTWELTKADLATLLDLSTRLNLDGEITPVMAWGMILAHPRLTELSTPDFLMLAEVLRGKVRCYGFGAVMEEFEVRDAIENVLSTKPEPMTSFRTENVAMAY